MGASEEGRSTPPPLALRVGGPAFQEGGIRELDTQPEHHLIGHAPLRVHLRDSSFAERLKSIRDAWHGDRELFELSRQHDRVSQARVVDLLYDWLEEALADVRCVFGESLVATLSARPLGSDPAPSFTLSVSPGYEISVALVSREAEGGLRWHTTIATRAGLDAPLHHAGPDRRHAAWTRARIEDLVLSLLSAEERARWVGR